MRALRTITCPWNQSIASPFNAAASDQRSPQNSITDASPGSSIFSSSRSPSAGVRNIGSSGSAVGRFIPAQGLSGRSPSLRADSNMADRTFTLICCVRLPTSAWSSFTTHSSTSMRVIPRNLGDGQRVWMLQRLPFTAAHEAHECTETDIDMTGADSDRTLEGVTSSLDHGNDKGHLIVQRHAHLSCLDDPALVAAGG